MLASVYAYLSGLLRTEEGADLVEYAMILALVVVVAIVLLSALGDEVIAVLSDVIAGLQRR